jgi:SAM-dependent methyltransferase
MGQGASVKYRLLQWLACPSCRGQDLRLETARTRTIPVSPGLFTPAENELPGVDLENGVETEVIEGALHCGDCGAAFPIREGVPRMMPADAQEGPATAHRWTTFDSARPEWEENFLDLADPLQPKDFLGRLVLDAGCGYGRHAYFAARFGAEVIALDSSGDAVGAAAENTRSMSRVHVVQGSIYQPPLKDGIVDLCYSFGVLHHLDEPDRAFDALGSVVRNGGRLSLWVYGPRQGLTLHFSNALRGATAGMAPETQHGLSRNIARFLRLFSHTPYRLLGSVPVAGSVVRHLPVHDHHQWPFDVVVADVWDRLRIPVRHWFPREKLELMFTNAGYADVHVSRRVRNTETFRATGVRR